MSRLNQTVAERASSQDWRDFIDAIDQLQVAGRTSAEGQPFWLVVELAKAPLFEGLIEEDGAQMEEEVLAQLHFRGMITLDEFDP